MRALLIVACCSAAIALRASHAQVPLPEHPRPDFQRAEWLNLNGRWRFAFDPRDSGERAGWPGSGPPPGRGVPVPFSWGAALSGVPGSADIGWCMRAITGPGTWRGRG